MWGPLAPPGRNPKRRGGTRMGPSPPPLVWNGPRTLGFQSSNWPPPIRGNKPPTPGHRSNPLGPDQTRGGEPNPGNGATGTPTLLGDAPYPLWKGGRVRPTQTITLAELACPATGDALPGAASPATYGIHTDAPLRAQAPITDYGSFVTIPPTYTDAITVHRW